MNTCALSLRVFAFFLAVAGLLVASACQHSTTPAASAPVTTTPSAPASGDAASTPAASTATSYVFGWGELPTSIATPRGGSTRGAPVTLAPGSPLPLAEIASAADDLARDRAAILALAGDYKASFHFIESLGLTADYKPGRPYHSWATEHVRVIEDTGRFISLQHTLVMFFNNPDGTVSEPMVMKHWRQDWAYEDTDLHTFRGGNTWARRRVTSAETGGAWSQAVFQVDDSPRYEALGRWEHRGNASVWTSERAWRPLPRREHTVRKDYEVMEGVHRIVLTPTGWLHEQNNWKRVAGEPAKAGAPPRFVAAEIGLDRYERITAPSLAAAEDYWRKTSAYWAVVRRVWADIFARHDRFTFSAEKNGKRLFEEHFARAEKFANGEFSNPSDLDRQVRETIAGFVELVATQP